MLRRKCILKRKQTKNTKDRQESLYLLSLSSEHRAGPQSCAMALYSPQNHHSLMSWASGVLNRIKNFCSCILQNVCSFQKPPVLCIIAHLWAGAYLCNCLLSMWSVGKHTNIPKETWDTHCREAANVHSVGNKVILQNKIASASGGG